jgi:hypothetical protein
MKTKCYCILCPRHPLYPKREEKIKGLVVGWELGKPIWKPEQIENGVEVDCLIPDSPAFDDFDVDVEDLDFKVTAYGDGQAITGVSGSGYEIYATCSNELEEDVEKKDE